MKRIANCTLVCVDTLNHHGAIKSLQKSMKQNSFDKVLFFTDKYFDFEGIEIVLIPALKSVRDYSHFVMKELYKYISTDYTLTVQHDGWTLNGDLFDERLYDYDYAGALWLNEAGYENGNGGYVWKTKRLLEAIGKDDLITAISPEDAQICRTYRDYLEKEYSLKWATHEICEGFSFELREPCKKTMGFHSFFHPPYKETIILKRSAACGDIVQIEPVARYFYEKGYRVVLDIPEYFWQLFLQHYFPVEHISTFDINRIPATVYDLDGSYEKKPAQLHLKSYFEACGISDYKLRNPCLSLSFDPKSKEHKLFKKYAIFHIDYRDQPGRCIYGMDWEWLVNSLKDKGYVCIQLGEGFSPDIPRAIRMKTPTLAFLKWVVGSSDLFVGIDSGISNIAVSMSIPSVIFTGNVDLRYIYADLSNVCWIHKHDEDICPKEKQFCWHKVVSEVGQPCSIDSIKPPCVVFDSEKAIEKINKFIDGKN